MGGDKGSAVAGDGPAPELQTEHLGMPFTSKAHPAGDRARHLG